MSKKVGILFSGGLDSTYLVWKNLLDGNEVYPYYIEIENNVVKTKLEKNRIKLLINEFREEFRTTMLHDITYVTNIGINFGGDFLMFKQLPIQIFTALYIQNNDIDELQVGFITGDDIIPYLDDIKNIYNSFKSVCMLMTPLTFPLAKELKSKIYQELPQQYHKFLFSCENATIIGCDDVEFIEYKPCCDCLPCREIIKTNFYQTNEFPEIYNENLIKNYAIFLHKHGFKVLDKNNDDYFESIAVPNTPKPHQLTLDLIYLEKLVCGDIENTKANLNY